MKLLSLLIVVISFAALTIACNYERMTRNPRYELIKSPAPKTIDVPTAHGICFAPNGNFAVVSANKNGKMHLYNHCGRLTKVVDFAKEGITGYIGNIGDCAFTDRKLFITDYEGCKIYEFTAHGKFVRVFASGERFLRLATCQDKLFVTIYKKRDSRNLIIYEKGKLDKHIDVPGQPRGVLIGIDDNIYVTSWGESKGTKLFKFTPTGSMIGKGAIPSPSVHYGDGIAMDYNGNLLVADHTTKAKVHVFDSCGKRIKEIVTGTEHVVDVEVGNDGTVAVADYHSSKVYLY